MKVKELIKQLETKVDSEAIVMVATIDDDGNTEMVEARIVIDVRSGDVEIVPAA